VFESGLSLARLLQRRQGNQKSGVKRKTTQKLGCQTIAKRGEEETDSGEKVEKSLGNQR
jgi:hypothetical protein